MQLEAIDPETALDLYISEKEPEVSRATIRSHQSRLGHFVRWCEERKIDNLNDLPGRKIHEYRLWRRNEGNLSTVSVKTQMDTLRVFVRWLGTIDGVDPELHVKVRLPDLRPGDNVRDVMLESENAENSPVGSSAVNRLESHTTRVADQRSFGDSFKISSSITWRCCILSSSDRTS